MTLCAQSGKVYRKGRELFFKMGSDWWCRTCRAPYMERIARMMRCELRTFGEPGDGKLFGEE
jgi:hypothetical protein